MTFLSSFRAAHPRSGPLLALGLVLVGSSSIQVSAALSSSLFATVGTLGVSGLRMAVAAVVLLALTRPSLRGRSPRAWRGVVLYGVAMAAMNVLFYAAVQRLPLGLAVTLEFLGPLTVAAAGVARRRELALPAGALVGVLLVAGPVGGVDALGVGFGLGAAVAFGAYTFLAGRVGDDTAGLDGLALSVAVGALALLPFSVPAVPRVAAGGWGVLVVSGLLGVALAFSLDFLAVRVSSTRVVGTLFAMDPVTGALVGAALLGDPLGVRAVAGILLVSAAGAATIWVAGRASAAAPADAPAPEVAPVPSA
ncbi:MULTISPECIES: EamA family transporter [Cellulomonas]|uniref:Inner membrane transporter RhtA n=1 Tax=Cellulomonas iranensis TaxID=76862 RepID=A0ABU0GJX7_9CELL|nr:MULTISPECIES: EamA family transporter [Cellulomonas]MDQ0425651.1 inner membrane transporter RhtA [Cellulomonas iranensis]TFH72067.1 EamA family transporter [Cellulomonas sp. HD19AZ1]